MQAMCISWWKTLKKQTQKRVTSAILGHEYTDRDAGTDMKRENHDVNAHTKEAFEQESGRERETQVDVAFQKAADGLGTSGNVAGKEAACEKDGTCKQRRRDAGQRLLAEGNEVVYAYVCVYDSGLRAKKMRHSTSIHTC